MLKHLQAKITTSAYYSTHFTRQSKAFHNSKPGLLFLNQARAGCGRRAWFLKIDLVRTSVCVCVCVCVCVRPRGY